MLITSSQNTTQPRTHQLPYYYNQGIHYPHPFSAGNCMSRDKRHVMRYVMLPDVHLHGVMGP